MITQNSLFDDQGEMKSIDLGQWTPKKKEPLQRVYGYLLDLSKKPEPMNFLFGKGENDCLMARGNLHVIKGQPKSGKSAFGIMLMTAALKGEFLGVRSLTTRPQKVLWIDTEQDRRTLFAKVCKVCEMAGIQAGGNDRLKVLSLMASDKKDRLGLVLEAMKEFKSDFVFLDGVVDLCRDSNDNKECADIVSELAAVVAQTDSTLLCAIHINKNDNEARGHLGAYLEQKGAEVYLLKRQGQKPEVKVEQRKSRFANVEEFSFRFGDGFSLQPTENNVVQLRAAFEKLFADVDGYIYTDLCKAYAEQEKVAVDTAKRKVKAALENLVLYKEGAGKDTVYRWSGEPKTVVTEDDDCF